MPSVEHGSQNTTTATVLFALNSLAGGGAERSTLQIMGHWQSVAFRPALLVGSLTGPYIPELPSADSITVVGRNDILRLPRYLIRVRRTIVQRRAVAIFASGYQAKALIAARWAGLIPAVAVIVVQRNDFDSQSRSQRKRQATFTLDRYLTTRLFRRADAIVGVSDGVSRDLERTLQLPAGLVTTIYNPIDTKRIDQAIAETVPEQLERTFGELSRPVVITTGRLVPQKAHKDLLDAFAILPEEKRGSLVILGEGPLRKILERKAESLGMRDRVWMPGFVSNPWWFIARSDVFALASHWEGFGRVLVEALACGIPVVSTDCPSGPRELLDGIPGTRLTPVSDAKELSHAIEQLLSDHDSSQVGRASLTAYAPRYVASQYAAVVSRVLSLTM